MKELKIVITGCVLFPSQGVEITSVLEIDSINFMDASKIDEFGENYLNSGGDSFAELHNNMVFVDNKAYTKFDNKRKEILKELKDYKENGATTSSHLDEISKKLDLINWSTDIVIKSKTLIP